MAALQVREFVAVRAHRDVHIAVHVLEYRLHRGLATGEEQVLGVGTPAPGSIVTLLPRATRTPAMTTWSVSGDTLASAPGSHHGVCG